MNKFAPRQSMHPDGDVTQAMNKRAEDVARTMKRNASFPRLRKVLHDYREEQKYLIRNM